MSKVNQQITADNDWIRQSFLLSAGYITSSDMINRVFTSASMKFTDTRLGGNFCINNVPQYTHFADVKQGSLLSPGYNADIGDPSLDNKKTGSLLGEYGGLGRFYSEQIDDNSQLIHFQFGIPEFSGMVSFFSGFYNNAAGTIARTGSIMNTIGYWLGRAGGFVASLYFLPILLVGYGLRFLCQSPSSKFYYMKPAMSLYWTRANSIANTLGVNIGLIAPIIANFEFKNPADYSGGGDLSGAYKPDSTNNTDINATTDPLAWNEADRAAFHSAMPSLYTPSGAINIYAVANRAQRLAVANHDRLMKKMDDLGKYKTTKTPNSKPAWDLGKLKVTDLTKHRGGKPPRTLDEYVLDYQNTMIKTPDIGSKDPTNMEQGFSPQWITPPNTATQPNPTTTVASGQSTPPATTMADLAAANKVDPTVDNTPYTTTTPWLDKIGTATWGGVKSYVTSLFDNIKADVEDGNQFVSFRVDFTGTTHESFSNSFRQSDVASKINGASSSARNAEFDFSDGETGISLVDGVTNAVKGFVGGALDSIHMSGLLALAGSAFVDIPEQWDNCSTQFPSSSYNIELRSPYGNPMSRYQNIFVPICLLLAGALPLSTGKQSYTSPFLCSIFNRGRVVSRLAMISDLSITRGTGNIGWTHNGVFLGADISITVKDLSTVIHAPINPSYSMINPIKGVFDEDNAWSDYMNTLSAMSLANQYYSLRKMILNINRKVAYAETKISAASLADTFGDTFLGRAMSIFARPAAVTGANN